MQVNISFSEGFLSLCVVVFWVVGRMKLSFVSMFHTLAIKSPVKKEFNNNNNLFI